MQPLESGQVWHMAELKMQVELVGKLLVHYKLAKFNAVRIPNSISSKVNIEKFLKKNKAVLVSQPKAVPAKK
jgi:menaquinone-dependent protoporphyrinogen IX oxidase